MDIVLASIGVVLIAPGFAVCACLIKREDGGPVIYRGLRTGRNGVPFVMYKFRTMVENADQFGGPSTANDDPRLTGIGKRLRKHKLDELPQLYNVLKGDMSLVGPRPEVKAYTDMFNEEESAILSVRPGITDWASLWNADEGELLAGSQDSERVYREAIRPQKIRLQLRYVREKSFKADMRLLFETVKVLMRRLS